MSPTRSETPSIRGAYIGPSKAWIIRTYGAQVFDESLKELDAGRRLQFDQQIVSVQWYPLQDWTEILNGVRRRVKAKTGEDGPTFDKRNVNESISTAMRTIYRIAFSLLSSTTVVAKVTPLFQKVYSHGSYQVMHNVPDHCILRFRDAPVEMLEELRRSFPIAATWMLETAGQQVTNLKLTEEVAHGTFTHDLALHYRSK